ncbi:hypothetical protein PU629_20745 [Pullulanibacillus sp. KACC 23026]|uniref:hypothetical protein n=1 Tax=Pullulanibacillus sp. KACC 23026 TaxID=3028315 RepID=UPI0023AE97E5|nr:hypothetical protein [Pullulanibacillus sp. KACC 23026]WEG12498.1 hypothetical protein PU629_20745 [Pullulanibacillus sp. KACC 23026]
MPDELKDLLVKMNERLERQEKMMQQLISIVADNKENITALNGRFDNVDKRLEEVEDRLDVMDQRSERIEAAVNRIEKNEPANIMSQLRRGGAE